MARWSASSRSAAVAAVSPPALSRRGGRHGGSRPRARAASAGYVRLRVGDAPALRRRDVRPRHLLRPVRARARRSAAAAEALRVLRPGGMLLASTPSDRWRYPYSARSAPSARRRTTCSASRATCAVGTRFQTSSAWSALRAMPRHLHLPVTALCHDVAFSRLPTLVRVAACAALAPLTWSAYLAHRPHDPGTETALAWRKA